MKIENRCTGEVILELSCDTLKNAALTGADLTGADLTRANLTGANLTRADLTWADLTGAFVMLGGRKFFLAEELKK